MTSVAAPAVLIANQRTAETAALKSLIDSNLLRANEGEERLMVQWVVNEMLAGACRELYAEAVGTVTAMNMQYLAERITQDILKNIAGHPRAKRIQILSDLSEDITRSVCREESHRS